eukprot:TRINITY_DN105031_c0_g1_i1.p2 TRINITY_DN105031_c0_g1~~TRINITY_DN105031_c0_g1_i1.p2  ORF type:complete len:128 (+),score=11.25 TRINITY_DN105031_c0_g1_i1:47-385(+)
MMMAMMGGRKGGGAPLVQVQKRADKSKTKQNKETTDTDKAAAPSLSDSSTVAVVQEMLIPLWPLGRQAPFWKPHWMAWEQPELLKEAPEHPSNGVTERVMEDVSDGCWEVHV